ncbi:hypothetical protein SAMN05421678_10815 [Actinopolymorpha cephalotaxi]|uniref:Uncharacterized protein n=1 Tax=Actinopolymorpha cephalotaxi TaxID=504797 RepID=A0A1I2U428_9ACTN|nr:hypothetical protein [Actinopolymorpha cephalotaxi]NYH86434.1 hypothetical protein [Actinopolymorpha cephalotaxi]SFG71902.1 hypothetical protein SAMN05421678_10815 [Actinopolymorpha cephalotaxi]
MSRRVSLAAAVVWVLAALSVAATALVGAPDRAYAGQGERAGPVRPVVLVGIGGLTAGDVSPARTPTLAALVARGAPGVLVPRSVRTHTCPLDGWLTVSAGERAAGPATCGPLPRVAPIPGGAGTYAVPGWRRLVAAQAGTGYGAEPGRLAEHLARAGTCTTAVGPGAAVALADRSGTVARYLPAFDRTAAPTGDCPLTVVDGGALPRDAGRAAAVAAADALVAKVVAAAGPGATVLVAGLSDESSGGGTSLRLAAAAGPGFEGSWLTSGGTRREALVQLTDLTPTLTELLGTDTDEAFDGGRWRTTGDRPAGRVATLDRLRAFDTTDRVVGTYGFWFFTVLVLAQLAAYGLALLVAARTRRTAWRRRTGRLASAAGLVCGAAPIAAVLAGLVPWATSPVPVWSLVLSVAAFTAVLATLAGRTPYDPPWAAPTTLALITAVVLGADVLTGSHLQGGNLVTPGDLPLVGGRYFGFGNVAFAIFATAALLAAGGLAARSVERHHRRRAAFVVLAIGFAAVVLDGWPSWGADFGGVLALVPGVLVLAANVAGIRLTVRRVVLVAVATVAAVGAVSVADWLRPPESRSHLGTFVQRVAEGQGGPVVARKAEAALASLTYGGPLGWLTLLVYVGVGVFLLRPRGPGARALAGTYLRWPTARPTLRAVWLTGLLGFALNDSGVAVLAAVLMTGGPLVVVALVRSSPDMSRGPSPRLRAPADTGVSAVRAGQAR